MSQRVTVPGTNTLSATKASCPILDPGGGESGDLPPGVPEPPLTKHVQNTDSLAEKAKKTHPPTAGLWTRKTEQGARQAPCFVDISWNENRMIAVVAGEGFEPSTFGL